MLQKIFRFFYILVSIFFKKWDMHEIIYLRNEVLLFFSSYVNIALFIYFLFAFYLLYILFLLTFVHCGFSTICWVSNAPVYIFYFAFILLPFEFFLIFPFIKNFTCNIRNFIFFCFFGKIKLE